MGIIALILKLLGLVNIPIFLALFYDHRNNPGLAFKYILGFITFILFGMFLVLTYNIYAILMAPVFIWGYFFIMFCDSQLRNKKNEKIESDLLDN